MHWATTNDKSHVRYYVDNDDYYIYSINYTL